MDEVKLREDARNVQHQVLEKDIATLKEENLSVSTNMEQRFTI